MRRRPPPAGALTTHVPGLVRASVVWPFPLWPPGQPPWLGATVGLRRFHLSVLAGGRGCGAFCAELLKNVTTGRRRQAPWDTRGARPPPPVPRSAECLGPDVQGVGGTHAFAGHCSVIRGRATAGATPPVRHAWVSRDVLWVSPGGGDQGACRRSSSVSGTCVTPGRFQSQPGAARPLCWWGRAALWLQGREAPRWLAAGTARSSGSELLQEAASRWPG